MSETMMNDAALRSDLLSRPRIRVTALCILQHRGRILVAEGYDTIRQKLFWPLGGGIEFGEHGRDTVIRELKEEIGSDVLPESVRYIDTVENIFTYKGQMGHEIVLLYDGQFADPALYEQDELAAIEDNGVPFRATWMRLDEFGPDVPLFPDGLLQLLKDS